jgi:uncharacterized protein
MNASAKATVLRSLPGVLRDAETRSFLSLGQDEAAHLVANVRPLPWLDGLIAAVVVAPEEPDDWLDHIWADGALGRLTPAQAKDIETLVEDHYCHVLDVLFESPHIYSPHLHGATGEVEAAAQWAAGFRSGIRLNPEPWRPLIDDDASRVLLAAVFCLEREEDLPEEEKAEFPFRDISPARREEMRRMTAGMLPDIVRGLHEFSLALDADLEDDCFGEPPHTRTSPKTGRNDPCPCGSGKKYKKCCLDG